MPRPEPVIPVSHLKLPCSGSRTRGNLSFCRILTGISQKLHNVAFEGPIHRSGSLVAIEEFGKSPTVIECAGRAAPGRHQPVLWILWTYDWNRQLWREVARAPAFAAEWAEVLRLPAIDCLNARPELFEIRARGAELAEELIEGIDKRLTCERREIQVTVLTTVYDRIAGKIAECA